MLQFSVSIGVRNKHGRWTINFNSLNNFLRVGREEPNRVNNRCYLIFAGAKKRGQFVAALNTSAVRMSQNVESPVEAYKAIAKLSRNRSAQRVLKSLTIDSSNTPDLRASFLSLVFDPANREDADLIVEFRSALAIVFWSLFSVDFFSPGDWSALKIDGNNTTCYAFLFENHGILMAIVAASRIMENRYIIHRGDSYMLPMHLFCLWKVLSDFRRNTYKRVSDVWEKFIVDNRDDPFFTCTEQQQTSDTV